MKSTLIQCNEVLLCVCVCERSVSEIIDIKEPKSHSCCREWTDPVVLVKEGRFTLFSISSLDSPQRREVAKVTVSLSHH